MARLQPFSSDHLSVMRGRFFMALILSPAREWGGASLQLRWVVNLSCAVGVGHETVASASTRGCIPVAISAQASKHQRKAKHASQIS